MSSHVLGKLSFSADGLQASLNTPSTPESTAFTLIIQLALSLVENVRNFDKTKTRFTVEETSIRVDFDYQNFSLTVDLEQSDDLEFYKFQWSKPNDEFLHYLKDKIELGYDAGAKWYGGAMVADQAWPIQTRTGPDPKNPKRVYGVMPFVLNDIYQREATGQERYWLCSKKIVLSVPWTVPLWTSIDDDKLSLQSQVKDSPFLMRNNFLQYELVVPKSAGMTLQQFHSKCFAKYLKSPLKTPCSTMMRKPVWSTWALYWSAVNQQDVLELAKKVAEYKFPASQIELDDRWTTTYGDYEIDTVKFPDFTGMIEELKRLGVPRLTAWVHPFINVESKNGQNQKLRKFWLKNFDGLVLPSKWWDGKGYVVDMTNPEAVDWFKGQLKNMQKLGIFTFKFDAGESNFMPKDYTLFAGRDPNDFGRAYTRMIAEFGPAVENRFASGTQESSVFYRTMDRNSEWATNGGLNTLIPWALTASLHGYFWNLPDMIGGNGKFVNGTRFNPGKEIYCRWAQANAFLLAMQFSFTPWQFDEETIEICRNVLKIREKWMDYILECTKKAVSEKAPVIRPMWWVSDAPEAFACSDQYLVGDRLLVAPVVEEGATSRKVFLPVGQWRDGNSGNITEGPTTIDVDAPLSVLPFFELVSSSGRSTIVGNLANYVISLLVICLIKCGVAI